ncbi:MAG: 3-hydroxyacyl-ACP dehydratase FabZ [Acidobacteriota bacterium]|nr:3-hydroxyacyl-ACP dehydratase FabZ [Blastocatellia bacterium]MDW8239220.1 3-hydroxyacyl-ACP dehydratase FabZ [Acidobacteriota bacterium]
METMLDITEIMNILPHRYPFLLVDRVIEYQPRQRIVAIKNVSINEPFFQGHFPGAPVMPGVLVLEAMAQVAGILMYQEVTDHATKLMFFTGLDKVRWRQPVFPGDTLRMELTVMRMKARFFKLRGEAFVDGQLVAEAEITSALVDKHSARKANHAVAQRPNLTLPTS